MKTARNYYAILTEGFDTTEANGVIQLSPEHSVQSSEAKDAFLTAPVTGVAGNITITFGGTPAVGDEFRLTVTSNLTSRQQWRKSYSHIVQAGAVSVTAVAAAFAALVTADISATAPYASAVNVAGVLTITQIGDDKRGLVGYVYTDSAAGTMSNFPTATVVSEGQPDDLVDRGVDAADINLAAYDTVRIVLHSQAAIPFIDSVGATATEIYWYGTVGKGAALVTQITT